MIARYFNLSDEEIRQFFNGGVVECVVAGDYHLSQNTT